MYPKRIVITEEVYSELSIPSISHLKNRVDKMVENGDARIESISVGTDEYKLYLQLTRNPLPGHIVIGRGEASAIVKAKEQNGILASNNLKDIAQYISEFGLINKTTGDILKEALINGLISEERGNQLWMEMLRKRRKLGYSSFSEYLEFNSF